MNNYEYIVASLPILTTDMREKGGPDPEGLVGWIRSQCSDRDNALIDILEAGFDGESLDEEFYRKALSSGNGFLKGYFSYDLTMRNEKVRWLNKALGRPEGQDVVAGPEPRPEDVAEIAGALGTDDILGREKALDDLLWGKIASLTTFSYFDIDAVLAFLAKMNIIRRWMVLDDETGREMFQNLVDEVRGTFKGVNYKPDNQTDTIL